MFFHFDITIRFFLVLHSLIIVPLLEKLLLQATFEAIALYSNLLETARSVLINHLVSVVTIAKTRTRKCYDFKFRQAVINHAEENINQEAARNYSGDEIATSIYYFFI